MLFVGEDTILDHENIKFARVMRYGSLVYITSRKPCGHLPPIERMIRIKSSYERGMLESAEGHLSQVSEVFACPVVDLDGNLLFTKGMQGKAGTSDTAATESGDKLDCFPCIHDIVIDDSGSAVIVYTGKASALDSTYDIRNAHHFPEALKESHFGGFFISKGGVFCYIGTTTRHSKLCWFVDGQEGPGFKRITHTFHRGDDLCYYGLYEGHLHLMKLPV